MECFVFVSIYLSIEPKYTCICTRIYRTDFSFECSIGHSCCDQQLSRWSAAAIKRHQSVLYNNDIWTVFRDKGSPLRADFQSIYDDSFIFKELPATDASLYSTRCHALQESSCSDYSSYIGQAEDKKLGKI